MAIKTIMVPIDGSEPSTRAMTFAAELAGPLGAEVELVTVMDLGQLDFYDNMYQTAEELEQWQARIQSDVLQVAADQLDGIRCKTTLLRGPTVKTLLAHMRATNPDLVVMGRTGRTAVNRILHGSVSRRLSASSPVPVALVG